MVYVPVNNCLVSRLPGSSLLKDYSFNRDLGSLSGIPVLQDCRIAFFGALRPSQQFYYPNSVEEPSKEESLLTSQK